MPVEVLESHEAYGLMDDAMAADVTQQLPPEFREAYAAGRPVFWYRRAVSLSNGMSKEFRYIAEPEEDGTEGLLGEYRRAVDALVAQSVKQLNLQGA